MSIYVAIDLKSFYASVECVEHGFDPLKTNLVVADKSRTEKTICLAVSPSLKAYGIGGRARLFEVVQRVKEVNAERLRKAPYHKFTKKSYYDNEVQEDNSVELDYYIATPRMAYYMKYSSMIYDIYLRYVSKDDIHVYSIDEVFIDVTNYLKTYKMSAHELAMTMIGDILKETGITATCGIGTNMYLAKIAMDIVAKHMPADEDGVRIAELDELSYRKQLWEHRPLTDFWRIGPGITNRLEANGLYTQGDIARCSIENEDKLYDIFGINAELIIDHAWGYEPCTIKEIKSYKPQSNSLSSGQVLKEPYTFEKAKLVMKEMTDALVLDLVDKKIVTDQMVLSVGYDISSTEFFNGVIESDRYGRKVPKQAHGSINLGEYTSSTKVIMEAVMKLFDSIVNKKLMVRRMYIVANHLLREKDIKEDEEKIEQTNLFVDYEQLDKERANKKKQLKKERKMQEAILTIQKKYGKNAILKGNNFEEGATAIERNGQIGGHKA
ncbi:MAG: DNA methylase [Erysipelotrichaceae bacterium]|nr:DNA methylase [Erysipelotrichaceae bacterium]